MTRAFAVLFAASFLIAPHARAGSAQTTVPAAKDRVKQLHDSKVKTGLGLPTASYGHGYSTISNKWTPGFRVSPPVEWVTDWDEDNHNAVYTVRLSLIRFPDGSKKSLYSPAQKTELFKNMVGHIYKLTGKRLDQALTLAPNKALCARFAEDIDGKGFDFPTKIAAPR